MSTEKEIEEAVKSCQGMLKTLANQYSVTGFEFYDHYQEGVIGVLEAIKRYDATKSSMTLVQYSAWWIKQSIRRAIVYGSLIKIPQEAFVRRDTFDSSFIRSRNKSKNLDKLGLSRPEMGEYVANPIEQLVYVEGGFREVEAKHFINRLCKVWNSRERDIIKMYYIEYKSLRSIGSELNISWQRVHQLLTNAIKKARKYYTYN